MNWGGALPTDHISPDAAAVIVGAGSLCIGLVIGAAVLAAFYSLINRVRSPRL